MTETFLHYLFEYQLIDNQEFKIISPGLKNPDAGPDFFNAKIEIDGILWVGNVEIHINASDWNHHKHQFDKVYDNIILHLVYNKDIEVKNTTEKILTTHEIKFNKNIYNKYLSLIHSLDKIHCHKEIQEIEPFIITQQIESLAISRLKRKSKRFEQLIKYNEMDAESAFFQALAIGFGGKVNAVPFELMAKETPLKVLLKNRHDLQTIEAILVGQAGILDEIENSEEKEVVQLQELYTYEKHKYGLKAIRNELLKYSKIRPYGFPDLKLAYLAKLIYAHNSLLQEVYEYKRIEEVKRLFNLEASTFWDTHYRVAKPSEKRKKKLGKDAQKHLMINIIIPFMYAYAHLQGNSEKNSLYIEWLEDIKPESNNITKSWKALGIENRNALESQGLIELKKEMCEKHYCLDCKIGHQVLKLSWE